ncbi:ABC transporter family protein [Histomonas meleagridis]|uniref:ABC transporter family protein n=1 Tax=Histomonas meleagridis TaxID=135588 RepID=UPI0035597340|nr:ABC transporter family protein [Histomonas meleagridis]KAH0803446.1 ABC transporter family protein [Histomonas meleagridis]
MSSSDSKELSDIEEKNPLGNWSDLKYSFNRQVRALFKKQFVIKKRHAASIIEYLISLILVFVNYLIYILSKEDYTEIVNPPVSSISSMPYGLLMFLSMNEPAFVVLPNATELDYLVGNTTYLHLWLKDRSIYSQLFNYTLPYTDPIPIQHVETQEEMEEIIYRTDRNGIGIRWVNVRDEDAITNPNIELFYQMQYSLDSSTTLQIYQEIRDGMAKMASKYYPNSGIENYVNDMWRANYNSQEFSRVGFSRGVDVGIAIAFISILPIVLSTMPDFQTVLEEKDSHSAAMGFLMGCSESAYWFVSFFTPFIMTIVQYIILAATLTYWFGMIGTDFTLFLVIVIFFIISHIWFQLWISTFMKKGSTGRAVTVVILVFVLFFAYLHQFFTLDENNSSIACAHIFSIIPFSAFEMFLMGGYTQSINDNKPFTWATLNDASYTAPPWIPLMWLIIDSIFYFLLFVLFNATNKRQFGTPIIRWSEFFNKDAWRRVFQKPNSYRVSPESDKFLEVNNLSKVYHSHKDITALDDVNFYVDSGEVILLIGPNGAGKSTLINIISGAIEPSDGQFRLLGRNKTNRFKEIQNYLGVCFQDNVIINLLTVREHFELFGAFRGVNPETLENCIQYFAREMQLDHMLDSRAGDLSGGQKRKLCIGLSLLGNPPFVLMDEPTAGVDVQARQLIWKMVSSLTHTTSIITSHALEEAEAVSSRLFILAGGKLLFCGNSTELRNKYKCGYLLRIERDDGKVGPVLDLVKKYIPEAHVVDDREDTITIPVSPKVSEFLQEFDKKMKKMGVKSYSFSVEQIEDMLLKLIQSEEAKAA